MHFLSYKMIISVPIFFVLFIGCFKLRSVQPAFTDNTHGFLRNNKILLNDTISTSMYTDGIDVYEDDTYLPKYSNRITPVRTDTTIRCSNNSDFINDKQIVEYFDRNHLIDTWKISG
jgi:hypothetical protein